MYRQKIIIFLLVIVFSSPVLAWRYGEKLENKNQIEIICNNDLKKIITKEENNYCFVAFLEKEKWCFPNLDEASTAICRASGTQ